VLNSSFKPPTGEQDLFRAEQKYMYAGFKRLLQIDKGKALVRSYKATADAQKIFKELCEDALRCTCSSITLHIDFLC